MLTLALDKTINAIEGSHSDEQVIKLHCKLH